MQQQGPLDKLLDRWEQQWHDGVEVPVDELCRDCPEYKVELERYVAALKATSWLDQDVSEATITWDASRGSTFPSRNRFVRDVDGLARLGDFRILREIGQGGMGVVYESIQETLGRHVALKVLPMPRTAESARLQRFQREARAAAKLHHTNIVPVFGVGNDRGVHFIAMQFIEGRGLDAVLREVKLSREQERSRPYEKTDRSQRAANGDDAQPDSAETSGSSVTERADSGSLVLSAAAPFPAYCRDVAHVGMQVAEALSHAHMHGVLHRDIKPSNLLLDEEGTVWVTDFGLAKHEDDDLTATGSVVGTLRYLAPECLDGRADARSDVYSLGATLYEMLTLERVYPQRDQAELVRRIAGDTGPPRPRSVDPRIPLDLETIAMTAIEKDLRRRYQTADELAQDLRLFLADKPIQARRVSLFERGWRWCRRNPLVASLSASIATLLVCLLLSISVAAVASSKRARQLKKEKDAVTAALFNSHVDWVRAARLSGRTGQRFDSLDRLNEALTLVPAEELTDEEAYRLRNEAVACMALADLKVVEERTAAALPGHRCHWVTGSFDHYYQTDWQGKGSVALFRATNHEKIFELPAVGREVWGAWLDPSRRFLVIRYAPHENHCEVRAWELERRKLVRTIETPPVSSPGVWIAPTGELIAGQPDKHLHVYDLAENKELRTLPAEPTPHGLAFHPTKHWIAAWRRDNTNVRILNLDTGEVIRQLRQPQLPWEVTWSDSRLAVSCRDFNIYVWDADSGAQTSVLQGHVAESWPFFDPAGNLLYSRSWDGTTRVWNPQTGRQLVRLKQESLEGFDGNQTLVSDFDFDPDDATYRLFQAATGKECRTYGYQTTAKGPWQTSFHPGGRLLATPGDDGIRLWDLMRGCQIAHLQTGKTECAFFHPSGKMLITGQADGVHLWPVVWNQRRGTLRLGPPQSLADTHGRWSRIAISSDGKRLLTNVSGIDTSFEVGKTAVKVCGIGYPDARHILAVSPDGKLGVVPPRGYRARGAFEVWDLGEMKMVRELNELPGGYHFALFSPDGRMLITNGSGNGFIVWDTKTWRPLYKFHYEAFPRAAFSPDSSMLALNRASDRVQLVEPTTGRQLVELEAFANSGTAWIAFSPDGGRLAVARTKQFQVWDLARIRAQLKNLGLDWTPPGKYATSDDDGSEPLRVKILN